MARVQLPGAGATDRFAVSTLPLAVQRRDFLTGDLRVGAAAFPDANPRMPPVVTVISNVPARLMLNPGGADRPSLTMPRRAVRTWSARAPPGRR